MCAQGGRSLAYAILDAVHRLLWEDTLGCTCIVGCEASLLVLLRSFQTLGAVPKVPIAKKYSEDHVQIGKL